MNHAASGACRRDIHHPTLLLRPNPDQLLARVEVVLPDAVSAYCVMQVGDAWSVVHIPSGEQVYAGLGPVEVVRSQAPY